MRQTDHQRGVTLMQRGMTLIETMIVVAIIGILASTALPSYIKWVRKAQAAEATMNIRKIFDSSVIYFALMYSDEEGSLLNHRFPDSTPMHPSTVPDGRSVLTSDWDELPTWHALHFAISDPHRYAYQYDSSGRANGAQFTVSAFADLDFDGEASTFARFATVYQMEVRGSGGLYVQDPLE